MRTQHLRQPLFAVVLTFAVGLAAPVAARPRPTDEQISFRVLEAVRNDTRIASNTVDVVSHDGFVTLSGVVDTLAARRYADLETKKIDGVLGVLNEIEVEPTWRPDTDLRQTVLRRIHSDPVIRSQHIRVTATLGSISLEGTVDSNVERNEAEMLCREVQGVKTVTNRLDVHPSSKRADKEIEKDLRASLDLDVYLSSLPISVFVEGGTVHLTGSVGSAYEKERAGWKARWLPGVEAVKNDLVAKWWESVGERKQEPLFSDVQLRDRVLELLRLDPRLDAEDISASVSSGLVQLGGSVPFFHQAVIAEQDARETVGVTGVTNLIVNRFEVRPDEAVTEDIRHNLRTDPATEGFDISVAVQDGVATLHGRVGNWARREHVKDVAGRVRGVRRVVDQLVLEPPRSLGDDHIASEVRYGVRWNWSTSAVAHRIRVAVDNGVVRLTGDVERWSQRNEAERIARRTEGVRKVDNQIQLKKR